jgi:ribosomal protein L16 Arg81 hydroxylase
MMDSTNHPRISFEHLIAPLTPQSFFANYWEQRHFHLARNDRSHFAGLFSLADVDAYLTQAAQNPAAYVSIIRVGQPVQRVRVQDANLSQLYSAFHAGNTLLLEAVERDWPSLAHLARTLRNRLSAQIHVNVYLSPPGAQGAHLHSDIHDVLAVHLEGAKDWWLYEGRIHEPREDLSYIRLLAPSGLKSVYEREAVDRPVAKQLCLQPGDVLYMPRGLVHKAIARQQAHSLHLAITISPIAWVEVLKAAAEVASAHHPELSRSLWPGFETMDTKTLATMVRETFHRLAELASQDAVLEQTIEVLKRSRMGEESRMGDGHFEQLLHLEEISDQTWIERREHQQCEVASSGKGAVLYFGADQMSGPPGIARALHYIRVHQRFQVRELPALPDEKSRIILVKRLIREGLLRADWSRVE